MATLRNARGGDVPNVVKKLDCEDFGADGITVHPRPDESASAVRMYMICGRCCGQTNIEVILHPNL